MLLLSSHNSFVSFWKNLYRKKTLMFVIDWHLSVNWKYLDEDAIDRKDSTVCWWLLLCLWTHAVGRSICRSESLIHVWDVRGYQWYLYRHISTAYHDKKTESIVLHLLRANNSCKQVSGLPAQVSQHASQMTCILWVVSWLKCPADGSPALSDDLLSYHCRPLSCKPVWHGQLTQITVVRRSISHLFLLVNGFDRCWKV